MGVMQLALPDMHRQVSGRVTKERQRQIEIHNKKTNVHPEEFWLVILCWYAECKTEGISSDSNGPAREE